MPAGTLIRNRIGFCTAVFHGVVILVFVGAIPAAYFPKQIVVESNHRNRKKRRKVLNQGSTIIVNISIFLIALTEHEVTGNLSEAACTEDKEYFDDDYFAF